MSLDPPTGTTMVALTEGGKLQVRDQGPRRLTHRLLHTYDLHVGICHIREVRGIRNVLLPSTLKDDCKT